MKPTTQHVISYNPLTDSERRIADLPGQVMIGSEILADEGRRESDERDAVRYPLFNTTKMESEQE